MVKKVEFSESILNNLRFHINPFYFITNGILYIKIHF